MGDLINFDEPIIIRNYRPDETDRPTKQERENHRIFVAIYNHINGKRTLHDEYNLILEKKSTLPAVCRNFIIEEAKSWPSEK